MCACVISSGSPDGFGSRAAALMLHQVGPLLHFSSPSDGRAAALPRQAGGGR